MESGRTQIAPHEPEKTATGIPGIGPGQFPGDTGPAPGTDGCDRLPCPGWAGGTPACSAYRDIRQLVAAGRE